MAPRESNLRSDSDTRLNTDRKCDWKVNDVFRNEELYKALRIPKLDALFKVRLCITRAPKKLHLSRKS